MNPYDFVRVDWQRVPPRKPAPRLDRFSGWSGEIVGTITARTPIFLPQSKETDPQPFQRNGRGEHIIPGSSLKGLLRSLAETIGPGCWRLFDRTYRDHVNYADQLPTPFRACRRADDLCPACRMFGLVAGGTLLLGSVGFEDALAIPDSTAVHQPIYTPVLDTPKPRHSAWYLSDDPRYLRGRKFYFHQPAIRTLPGRQTSRTGVILNQHIVPLDKGSAFALRAHFDNLDEDDLALLLYSLVLEPDVRHKLGYAKPAGLGSVQIEITRLTRSKMVDRYLGTAPEMFAGADLAAFIQQHIAPFQQNTTSITLQDLRRIWRWPPQGSFDYPSQAWFRDHPQAPISATH